MNNEIHPIQRIRIWNKVLDDLEIELHYDFQETAGICSYLIKELLNEGICSSPVQASINLPRLFPEFDKHRPDGKQWFNMWWKNDNIAKRINVVKEIINQLETEQSTVITKTE